PVPGSAVGGDDYHAGAVIAGDQVPEGKICPADQVVMRAAVDPDAGRHGDTAVPVADGIGQGMVAIQLRADAVALDEVLARLASADQDAETQVAGDQVPGD